MRLRYERLTVKWQQGAGRWGSLGCNSRRLPGVLARMNPYEPRHGAVSLTKNRDTAAPPAAPEAEGALVVAIRWPVRIVVLVLVVPVRMAWDALVVAGRALRRTVLRPLGLALMWLVKALFVWPWAALWRYVLAPAGRGVGAALVWLARNLVAVPLGWIWRQLLVPLGRGLRVALHGLAAGLAWIAKALFVWPWAALWRYVLAPAGRSVGAAVMWLARVLVVAPSAWVRRWLLRPLGHGIAAAAAWCYRAVLTPVGHALAAAVRGLGVALVWVGKALFVWPWVALWRYVLAPAGRGLAAGAAWLVRWLVMAPAVAVFRYVLTPLGRVLAVAGREIADAIVVCWRLAGRVSRAVFGFLGRALRWLFVDPLVWVWRHVLRPAGRGVRDHVWRPVAGAAREAGRAVRAALGAARASVRQTRADIRRALFGSPREPLP